jgi:hypothetical protein
MVMKTCCILAFGLFSLGAGSLILGGCGDDSDSSGDQGMHGGTDGGLIDSGLTDGYSKDLAHGDVGAITEAGLSHDAALLPCSPQGWSAMTSGVKDVLYDIWGSGPSNIFAVGESGTILHFNGQAWTTMSIPKEAGGKDLYAVWGSAADTVFIAGDQGVLLKGNAQGWSAMDLPEDLPPAAFLGVWGAGPQDVYAVGYTTFGNGYAAVILHYDGSSWKDMELPPYCLGPVLYEVWGLAANKVYAVGDGVMEYDGKTWTCLTSYQDLSGGRGVWGTSSSELFIVGEETSTSEFGYIYKYDGNDWTSMEVDFGAESSAMETVRDIWGENKNNVFAVGKISGNAGIPVFHYDGQKWSQVAAPSGLKNGRLNGIWGMGAKQAWAVGDDGLVLQWCSN